MNLDDRQLLRELGFRVRELRVQRGWSQVEQGRRCRLHRTFIGSVERGERNLAILNLRRITKALGVHFADLFAELG